MARFLNITMATMFFSAAICFGGKAAVSNSKQIPFAEDLNDLNQKYQKLEDRQIESERYFLKESYGSSISTITTVLGVLGGVLALLGFLGYKNLGDLKKRYEKELEEFRKTSANLQEEVQSLVKFQETIKNNIDRITTENKEQGNKIRVLELKNTARNYFKNSQFSEALDLYKHILTINEEDLPSRVNLLEFCLFFKDFATYEKYLANHKEKIEKEAGPFLFTYYTALKNFVSNDTPALKKTISDFLIGKPMEEKTIYLGWNFNDVRNFTKSFPDSPIKNIFYGLCDFLAGKISGNELNQKLV